MHDDKLYKILFYIMVACSLFNFFIKPFLPWFQYRHERDIKEALYTPTPSCTFKAEDGE